MGIPGQGVMSQGIVTTVAQGDLLIDPASRAAGQECRSRSSDRRLKNHSEPALIPNTSSRTHGIFQKFMDLISIQFDSRGGI